MRRIFSQNFVFYCCFLLFVLFFGIYLLGNSKGALSLWFNTWHGFTVDHIFRYGTWLGDGITITVIMIMLFFVQYRIAIFTSVISIISTVIVSIIKNIVNEPRPVEYFKGTDLHYVNGVELFHHLSFPSGHTAAAFALYCTLSFFVRKKWIQILFFLTATFVAMTRVYLFQHFLIDVYFGAIIGTINATFIYYLLSSMKLFKKPWADNSLFRKKSELLLRE